MSEFRDLLIEFACCTETDKVLHKTATSLPCNCTGFMSMTSYNEGGSEIGSTDVKASSTLLPEKVCRPSWVWRGGGGREEFPRWIFCKKI